MFSVTGRVKRISQPHGGYLPPSIFKTICFDDDSQLYEVSPDYKHIQGLAIDYLTRFMSGCFKEEAFRISLLGAELVSEIENANYLLKTIKSLDAESVCAACQLVGYDIAFRRGPDYFVPVSHYMPSEEIIYNIIVMVQRSLEFLKKHSPILKEGFTFEGGYTDVVSSGDGDYLSFDTLWDFKVSPNAPTSKHTLQLLMYYILGFHSVHEEFQYIKKIGIFNPQLNTAYELELTRIPDRVYHEVSREVLGYSVPEDPACWRLANSTDKDVFRNTVMDQYKDIFFDTGFRPDNYSDGIYDITIDDYWSYYRNISREHRPRFSYTHSIKFLKHDEFIMFISVSKNGSMCILRGGSRRRIYEPLEYYYDYLPEYARLVLHKFSQYWDALHSISAQLQAIKPDKEMLRKHQYAEYVYDCMVNDIKCLDFDLWYNQNGCSPQFSGRIHGCIVDLDYFNHIYLNPYDGKLIPYYAPSIYEKYVYKNVEMLIANKIPDMLAPFQRMIGNHTNSLMTSNSIQPHALVNLSNNEGSAYNAAVKDTKMYDISMKMKGLQSIYDFHLVEVWYDEFLARHELESGGDNSKSLLVGKSKMMRCGEIATVIEDYGPNNVSVKFADGHVVKFCRRDDFIQGKIKNKPKQYK